MMATENPITYSEFNHNAYPPELSDSAKKVKLMYTSGMLSTILFSSALLLLFPLPLLPCFPFFFACFYYYCTTFPPPACSYTRAVSSQGQITILFTKLFIIKLDFLKSFDRAAKSNNLLSMEDPV